jgi:hypothetical protein
VRVELGPNDDVLGGRFRGNDDDSCSGGGAGNDCVCKSLGPSGLFRSGLTDTERSCGGRGETGTLYRYASSGKSSSESWYSSSSSLIVLRLGCHELLLLVGFIEFGDSPDRRWDVPFGNDVDEPGTADGCAGDGDRDRCRGFEDSDSEGVEGLANPLFDPTLFGGFNPSLVRCINAPLI